MSITFAAKKNQGAASEMARSKKPTKPVRIHEDVAAVAEILAPIYGQSVPDFVSDQLRQVFSKLVESAPKQLTERIKKGLKPDP